MEAPSRCENGLCHPTQCAPPQCCHTRAVLHGPHLGCSSVPDVVHNHSPSAENAQLRIHSAMPFQGEHRCAIVAWHCHCMPARCDWCCCHLVRHLAPGTSHTRTWPLKHPLTTSMRVASLVRETRHRLAQQEDGERCAGSALLSFACGGAATGPVPGAASCRSTTTTTTTTTTTNVLHQLSYYGSNTASPVWVSNQCCTPSLLHSSG